MHLREWQCRPRTRSLSCTDADSGPLTEKLLKKDTLKTYEGFPRRIPTTDADTIDAQVLALIQSGAFCSSSNLNFGTLAQIIALVRQVARDALLPGCGRRAGIARLGADQACQQNITIKQLPCLR